MFRGRSLLVLLYAASGAAALVYEVVWTRMLTLQLGHTVAAASTVLAAFMGGLALGAWLATRLPGRGLRAYASLEIVVALSALVLPMALRAAMPALAWAYGDGAEASRFAITRVAISLVLLGVPAAAMGATFPIASDAIASLKGLARLDSAVLYTANTAGAAIGAIATGFWLIPSIGLRSATWVGALLNVSAAGGAWWLYSRGGSTTVGPATDAVTPSRIGATKTSSKRGRSTRPVPTSPTRRAPAPLLACVAVAVSGCAALIYEVAWTRLLALVVGPTTYAFATMAAAFISGLALGSAIGTRLAPRIARPAVWLSTMLVLSAVAASATAWFAATRMPLDVALQVADPAATFNQVVSTQALQIAAILLPMTLALGATFPLALAVAARDQTTIGRDAARVYTANTAGAIAGALIAGFILIPAFGLHTSISLAAIASALTGAGCLAWTIGGSRGYVWSAGAAVVSAAVVLLMPEWDHALLASGAYKYAPYLEASDFDAVLRAGTLEFYKEGAAGTVSVRRLNGTTSLAIDGKVDASNGGDMLTQRMLGLLPVLVHGKAREICVIGLGSGVTVGSALTAGTVQHADVVEISPEVVRASRYFDRESGTPLSNRTVRLIVGDGRSHLLLSSKRYDVIVSEPSNPWMAGVATLFTREFFEAARARLNPDGIVCQWAHTYDISAADLRSIVRTFASVFPEGTMWIVGGGDLLLVGAKDGAIEPRLAAVREGSARASVEAAFEDVGIAKGAVAFAVYSQFAGGPRQIQEFADAAPIQTDDRTSLEFSAPRSIYGRTRDDNAGTLRALAGGRPSIVNDALANASDTDWTSVGQMEMKAQAFATSYDAFRRAVELNSRNSVALSGLSDAAGGSGKLLEERDWLQNVATREPQNVNVRIELSRVRAVSGDGAGAIQIAVEAMTMAPDDPRAGEQVAAVLADAGDAGRLSSFAESLERRFPGRAEPLFYRATALFLSGRHEDAVAAARAVTAKDPGHARAQNLLGAACAALGRLDCALTAFEASMRANPRDAAAYVNAGLISLQLARPAAAEGFFAAALTIDPTSKPGRDGLGQARTQLFARRD